MKIKDLHAIFCGFQGDSQSLWLAVLSRFSTALPSPSLAVSLSLTLLPSRPFLDRHPGLAVIALPVLGVCLCHVVVTCSALWMRLPLISASACVLYPSFQAWAKKTIPNSCRSGSNWCKRRMRWFATSQSSWSCKYTFGPTRLIPQSTTSSFQQLVYCFFFLSSNL